MPLAVESVEQVMASLPVTVKVIVADELFAAVAARVTVGGVVSVPETRVFVNAETEVRSP